MNHPYLLTDEEEDEEENHPAKPTKLPYENQLIGVFLYGLGAAAALHQGESLPMTDAVSLLQQTPLDQSLADVLLGRASRAYLIEFKRRAAGAKDEIEKRDAILQRMSAAQVEAVWSGHLLAYPASVQASHVSLSFEPYLGEYPWVNPATFKNFATGFLDGSGGADAVSFRAYLKVLLETNPAGGTAGILVTITKEGAIVFQIVAHLAELQLSVAEHVEGRPTSSLRSQDRWAENSSTPRRR